MSDLSKTEKSLAKHIITLAQEEPHGFRLEVDDDVSINWDQWDIEEYDEATTNDGEPYIVIGFSQESSQSERVARSTRWQPAEYKNHDVLLFGQVKFFPERNGGFGECHGIVEQEGGRPNRQRSYEPEDKRI